MRADLPERALVTLAVCCRLPPKEDEAQQMAEAMVRDERVLSDLLQKGGAKIAGSAQPAAGGLIRGICSVG